MRRTIKINMAIDDALQENEYGDGAAWSRGPLLGKGSFGRVYKATLKNTNRGISKANSFPSVMAVKSAEVSLSGTLQTEKEIMCNFKGSPYVVTCFGNEATVGECGVMAYNLLLEYASGGTLSDRIKKSGGRGLPELEVRAHTQSILRGVTHIHSLGYVHCDLKPDNILLVPDGGTGQKSEFRAKIGDFGLAKRGKQPRNKKRKLVEPHWRGTPMYLAPEAVIHNVQEAPCDVWAVGCIVFKMLTGKPPWEGKNAEDILTKIGAGLELPKIPKEISEDARHFLTCCFERNPVYRLTAELLLEHPFVDVDHDFAEDLEDSESSCSSFSDGRIDSIHCWSEEDVDKSVGGKETAVSSECVWQRRENYPIRLSNIPAVNLMRLVTR